MSCPAAKACRPSRRDALLGGALGAVAALASPSSQNASSAALKTRAAPDSLGARAARRGLFFGVAVETRHLSGDPAFAAAVIREADVLTPAWEQKWGAVEPQRGRRNHQAVDAIVQFAARNGQRLRGHALVWYLNLPHWFDNELDPAQARAALSAHIGDICRRAGPATFHWDVVNEGVNPRDGRPDGLRITPHLRLLGDDYIEQAFVMAREAAPKARLYYNDFGVDYADADSNGRRASILRLLERLKSRGVPIDGLGVQGHLVMGRRFDAGIFRRFLADVAGIGLDIAITEFDVRDRVLPADPAARDRAVADHARAYVETALDERAVKGIVTWGLSDRYSWVNDMPQWRRPDGLLNRGLPLDEVMAAKPLLGALAAALDAAPMRAPN